ncbi:MAG TPA: dihydrofolate reductase family protein [Dermatophilaceae bacterium]|nr:dihydrofolate reductase family protein [Dermatophilaceae bacterium]
MRILLDSRAGASAAATADEGTLAAAYAWPPGRWVRANMVTTLDGSGVGLDGRSGSINTPADNRLFALQRRLADAVVVGAGTADAEGYGRVPLDPATGRAATLVVVTNRARVPGRLADAGAPGGRVVLATCAAAGADALATARSALGPHDVWVVGRDRVDLPLLRDRLAGSGMPSLLCEGGPRLLGDLLAEGLVDELALTLAPRLLGGAGARVVTAPPLGGPAGIPALPHLLLEEGGTLLGLWRVRR